MKDHLEVMEQRLNETTRLFDSMVLDKLEKYSKKIEDASRLIKHTQLLKKQLVSNVE